MAEDNGWLRHEKDVVEWLKEPTKHRSVAVSRLQDVRASQHGSSLSRLVAAFDERGHALLALGDDWDEEGSPGFAPSTIARAKEFLVVQGKFSWLRFSVELPAPRVGPGPNGSIDLHWETADREILVNVPPKTDPITFYGDNRRGTIVKGQTAVSDEPCRELLVLFAI